MSKNGNSIVLAHEDPQALCRMAVFAVIVNNAHLKGDRLVDTAAGHRHGVDLGLTICPEDKLHMVI